ncbi:MAG: glycosyl hydrolase, partial [Mucilaginibacter sp.]|nr:glycosyl hydrolase [Mucilaginibacter sp.]
LVMNKNDEKIDYYLWLKGKAEKISSQAHSIETLIIE